MKVIYKERNNSSFTELKYLLIPFLIHQDSAINKATWIAHLNLEHKDSYEQWGKKSKPKKTVILESDL